MVKASAKVLPTGTHDESPAIDTRNFSDSNVIKSNVSSNINFEKSNQHNNTNYNPISNPRLQRMFSNTALLGYVGPSGSMGSTFSRKLSETRPHFTDHFNFHHIQNHINWFYELKEDDMIYDYAHFQKQKNSTGFLLFLFCILIIIRLPSNILNIYYDWHSMEKHTDHEQHRIIHDLRLFTSFLSLFFTFIGIISSGVLIRSGHDPSCLAIQKTWSLLQDIYIFLDDWNVFRWIPRIHISSSRAAWLYMCQAQCFFIIVFLRRSFLFRCIQNAEEPVNDEFSDNLIMKVGGGGICVDSIHEPIYMCLNALMMFLLPLLLFTNIPEIRVGVTWVNYAAAVIVYTISAFYLELYATMLVSYLVIIAVAFIIMDIQKRNLLMFITNRKLKEILLENDHFREENQAAELRHMIGNVAHDLKTPLASFTTGVDFIEMMADEIQPMINAEQMNMAQCKDALQSIQSCVINIRNTTSFMMMTVNRCLDYTKASKGIKLKPRLDSMHLMDALKLPLDCMENIQNRIQVNLEAFPARLCSFIVTDKLWLQENVLCLLSNAVKHSTGGNVTLNVFLEEKKTVKHTQSEDESDGIFHPPTSSRMNGDPKSDTPMKANSGDENSTSINIQSRSSFDFMQIFNNDKFKLGRLKTKYEQLHLTLRSDSQEDMKKSVSINQEPSVVTSEKFIRFEVQDQSAGMTEELMSTLFNPMKKIQKISGGTGLGLYCLAKRVESLGGDYGVQRRKDGKDGSLFWFTIPYKPDEILQKSRAYSVFVKQSLMVKDPAPSPAKIWLSPVNEFSTKNTHTEQPHEVDISSPSNEVDMEAIRNIVSVLSNGNSPTKVVPFESKFEEVLNILIVDDSPAILKMTSLMLKKLGHTFTTAEHGDAALHIVEEIILGQRPKFDVILMDLQMPVMDGLEATKRIRSLEKASTDTMITKHQLIIGVSANSDHETVEEAYAAGIDTFMPKPFNVHAFCETITKLFPGRVIKGI